MKTMKILDLPFPANLQLRTAAVPALGPVVFSPPARSRCMMTKTSMLSRRAVQLCGAAALGAAVAVVAPSGVASAAYESSAVGFGAGTTGGAGGSTVTVTSESALASAVADDTARVVRVSGTFTGSDTIKVGSNK